MKKCRLIAAVIFFAAVCATASAQVGIEAGYINMHYSYGTASGGSVGKSSLNGFYAGVSDEMKLVAGLGIHVGLNYSYATNSRSTSLSNIFTSISENLQNSSLKGGTETVQYLNIPVRARYAFNIIPSILKIQVYAGPIFSFGLSRVQNVEINGLQLGTYNLYSGKYESASQGGDIFDHITGDEDDLSRYRRFETAIGGGLGVELFRLLEVKIGYDWGVTNSIRKNMADYLSCERDMFYVTLGLRF